MTLPNFLIIGAAKAGTTSLYQYLGQHPDVFMSPVKEPRYYWREGEAQGRVDIHTREAYERLFDGATSERAIGEASPQYLNSPTAPERIAADLPGVKLIVSLRNPADRAYSSYLGWLRGAEERRRADEALRPGSYYFETSLYHSALSRYFARFGKERIKVVLFDDLTANPRAVMRDLLEFLEVDHTFEIDVATRHNPAAVPRSLIINEVICKSGRTIHKLLPSRIRDTGLTGRLQRLFLRPPASMPASIRRRLIEQFSDDIGKTSALIGRDLSRWLQ
jgi:hypothetical protein